MSKAKKQVLGIPYVSEWDPDIQGRPIGLIAALVHMLSGWVLRRVEGRVRKFPGLPGPTLLKDELDALGLDCHLEFPTSPLAVLYGDLCLVNYARLPLDLVQDHEFRGWGWVVFLGIDDTCVYVHDPNWSGNSRNRGDTMAIPHDSWEAAFTAHTSGLQAIRLNLRGVEQIPVPPVLGAAVEDVVVAKYQEADSETSGTR